MTEGFRSEIRESDGSLEATARVVDAGGDDDERIVEAALRPKRLAEFPGQPRVRDQLGLVLQAAKQRGSTPDHVLLSGPPGLGKTTLAMIVAAEIERPIRVTSGPAIQHAGDLAAVLSSLDEGEVLFLDEIHRMSRAAEEMLYLAMEDFRVDVIVGKGPGPPPFRSNCPPSRSSARRRVPACCRPRCAIASASPGTSTTTTRPTRTILHRSARLLGVDADGEGIAEIAGRSRGTPRIANRLLRRVRDWAQVHGSGRVDQVAALAALRLFDVDAAGLDRLDRAVLEALCRRFAGGPVGLSTLAVAGGGDRHRRDGRRAPSGEGGLHGPHTPGPSSHSSGLGAPAPHTSGRLDDPGRAAAGRRAGAPGLGHRLTAPRTRLGGVPGASHWEGSCASLTMDRRPGCLARSRVPRRGPRARREGPFSMSSGAGTGNLLLLLLPLLLLGFLMWTQRKRSRDMQAVNASLTVGDEVMTSSGLYGRIVALDDSIATLEVAPRRQRPLRPARRDAATGDALWSGEHRTRRGELSRGPDLGAHCCPPSPAGDGADHCRPRGPAHRSPPVGGRSVDPKLGLDLEGGTQMIPRAAADRREHSERRADRPGPRHHRAACRCRWHLRRGGHDARWPQHRRQHPGTPTESTLNAIRRSSQMQFRPVLAIADGVLVPRPRRTRRRPRSTECQPGAVDHRGAGREPGARGEPHGPECDPRRARGHPPPRQRQTVPRRSPRPRRHHRPAHRAATRRHRTPPVSGWVTPELQTLFAALNCADPGAVDSLIDDPAKPLVTCDQTGAVKYILGLVVVPDPRSRTRPPATRRSPVAR